MRRSRRERARLFRRRALIAAAVAGLALMAMTPAVRGLLASALMRSVYAVQAFALPQGAQAEVTLREMKVYAVQLGAYDNGERAKRELERLLDTGVPAVIWQKEQMRLICSAAPSRTQLDVSAAQGQDAWVIEQTLPDVRLRVEAGADELEQVRTLLMMPDTLFRALCGGEPLDELLAQAKPPALEAKASHPEVPVYAQLAQSLINWCDLIQQIRGRVGDVTARHYASATLALLCDELRQALLAEDAQRSARMASAVWMPSTAADMMPPA